MHFLMFILYCSHGYRVVSLQLTSFSVFVFPCRFQSVHGGWLAYVLPVPHLVFRSFKTCFQSNTVVFFWQISMTSCFLFGIWNHCMAFVACYQSWTDIVRFFSLQVWMTSLQLSDLLLNVAHLVSLSCATCYRPWTNMVFFVLQVSMTSWHLAGLRNQLYSCVLRSCVAYFQYWTDIARFFPAGLNDFMTAGWPAASCST